MHSLYTKANNGNQEVSSAVLAMWYFIYGKVVSSNWFKVKHNHWRLMFFKTSLSVHFNKKMLHHINCIIGLNEKVSPCSPFSFSIKRLQTISRFVINLLLKNLLQAKIHFVYFSIWAAVFCASLKITQTSCKWRFNLLCSELSN